MKMKELTDKLSVQIEEGERLDEVIKGSLKGLGYGE